MCGRYVIRKPKAVARKMVASLTLFQPRYNLAPQQKAPIEYSCEAHGADVELATWGYLNTQGKLVINAKAETIATKPAHAEAYKHRRCLVWADGFIEWWEDQDGKRWPYLFERRGGEPFAFAGIFNRKGKEKQFVIVTTTPNDLVKPIHPERMPVMLAGENTGRWLADEEPHEELMRPYPSEDMMRTPVSRRANNYRNDDAKCLAQIPDERERGLFGAA